MALLEAGRRYKAETFPKNELDGSGKLFWGGGIEFSSDARLGFLRAKVLGGTSIVNQALLDRFDEAAFAPWREESKAEFFSTEKMTPYYDRVENSLSVQTIPPEHFNKNTRFFTAAFDRKGLGWTALRRGQKNCATEKGTDCIVCLNGCQRDSKQSTLLTSIMPAEAKGLETITQCEVQTFKTEGGVVTVQALMGGEAITLKARHLILAAGSVGTSKILLASGYKSKLRALGAKFTCHPQFMTYGVFDEIIDAHKGVFQAVKSYDPGLRKLGLKYENVFAGPIATAMLIPGYGVNHHRQMKKYRHMASLELAMRDDATGEISLHSSGKIIIKKHFSEADKNRLKVGVKLMREMYQDLNAREIVVNRHGFGLHLMGGASLGVSAENSVVDPEFRLHGDRRVTIADSSVFPSAPGINPSLTIMALSEMACDNLLQEASA